MHAAFFSAPMARHTPARSTSVLRHVPGSAKHIIAGLCQRHQPANGQTSAISQRQQNGFWHGEPSSAPSPKGSSKAAHECRTPSRKCGWSPENPNRAPPCSLPPPRQKLLCEVLSAKRKEGRGFEPPRRQARQGFPCLRSLSYFSFQISGFSPSSVFCLAVFCLFPLSVFLLFALRHYLLAHYALRRRRSRPAPSSRPASALVGSGTAVQVRLEPLAVK